MKTALVTGASGFVGRYVSKDLSASGYDVIGIGHGAWGRDEWSQWGVTDWHTADITSESLETFAGRPSVIVHCAGSGSVAYSTTNPAQDFRRSVDTTLAVLEFVRQHAVDARVVLPSSAAIYGNAATLPISVGLTPAPLSPYGYHKRIAEEICASYAANFHVSVGIVRLFSVYGIGLRKQILWDAANRAKKGDLVFYGTGQETRDLIHAEDAASLICKVAESSSSKLEIYNGGSGVATKVEGLISILLDSMGIKKTASFNNVQRPGDPQHYQADIDNSLKLGWRPAKDLKNEVAKYAQWFCQGAQ